MSNAEDLLDIIPRGKAAIVSRSVNSTIKLASIIANEVTKRGKRVVVVDELGYFSRYAPIGVFNEVKVVSSLREACEESGEYLVIALAVKRLSELRLCETLSVVVFTKSPAAKLPGTYVKCYLKRVPETSEHEFVCRDLGLTARVVLEPGEFRVVEGPPGIYGRAYGVLKNLLSSYGELTVKDAVRALSLELGIDKKRAKSIVVVLARRGYIKVLRGKVALA